MLGEREQMILEYNVVEALIMLDGLKQIIRSEYTNEVDRNIANELIVKIRKAVESELSK